MTTARPSHPTRFLLNDRAVATTEPPGLLVLDYLRRRARLTGTKEGCKEGDCGACAVLVGELDGERVDYQPVTSCLMPLGELQGKHLVTVEGLNLPEALTPVQRAIVDEGATQCGFCTPGIVVSMTGLLMRAGAPLDRDAFKYALSGHLCRCTGYRSLKAAGDRVAREVGEATGVRALVAAGTLPEWFLDAPARLAELQAPPEAPAEGPPAELLIAGGTDLYVQRGEDLPDARVGVLNLFPEMRGVARRNGHLRVGALTTFEEFAAHPEVRERLPEIGDYMYLIASWQIRNRATLGGNVINASPIGDMTVLLLALGSELVLADGDQRRTVPMTSFYKGYKVLDKRPGEILTEILIPELERGTRVGWEKVSKRKCLDIASVNSAIRIRTEGGAIADCRLAVGGVAPIPLELEATAEGLRGRRVSRQTVEAALAAAQGEISPISDVRGSADYKRLLTRQLLIAHFTKLFPEQLSVRDFHGGAP